VGTSQLSATTLPYLEPAREVVSCCWSGLAAFKQIPSALAVVVVVVVVVVGLHIENHPGLSIQCLLLSPPLRTSPTLDATDFRGQRLTYLEKVY